MKIKLMKNSFWIFFLLLSYELGNLSAQADIVPSFYMLRKMADKRSGIKGVKVVTRVKELSEGNPTGVEFKQITTFDEKSGLLRSWALDESDKTLYYMERKLGTGTTHSSAVGPISNPILFQSHVVPLVRALIASGVPVRTEIELSSMKDEEERRATERTALRRQGKIPVWSIGKAGDTAHLWIEKDGFLPIKWWLPAKVDAPESKPAQEEFLYSQNKSVSGFFYPQELIYYVAGKALIREELVSFTPGFLQPHAANESPSSIGMTELGKTADDRLRELLGSFYSHVR